MLHPPALSESNGLDPKQTKVVYHPYFKKIFVPFLSVLVLAAGAGLATVLIQRQQRLATEASGTSQVDLSFSGPASVAKDAEFSLQVLIDAKNNTASAASVSATFDPAKLQVTNITAGPYFTDGFVSGNYEMLNYTQTSSGRATIIIGAPCPVSPPAGLTSTPCLVKTGAGVLATLTFKALQTGSAQISFDRSQDKTAVAIIGQDTTALGDTPTFNLTINTTTTVRPNLCQSTTASTTTLTPTNPITITSTANTADITKFHYVFYNLDNVENGAPKPIQFVAGTNYSVVNQTTNTATNSLQLSFADLNRPDLNHNGQLPRRIQINGYFTNTQNQFSSPETNCVVALTLQDAPTPQTNLQLSLRLQGITTQRVDKSISIDIKQQNNSIKTETVNFTADSTGIYRATLAADLTPGSYDIYVKGPAHLRRKFANVNIASGANQLDFSSTPLASGDINNDNKVDLLDYSAMVLVYEPGATKTHVADLNFDNKVDLLDYSLLVPNYRPGVPGD